MKKNLFVAVLAGAALLSLQSQVVFAENTTGERQNNLEMRREELTQKMEQKTEQLQERNSDLQDRMQRTRAEILAGHAERLRYRFLEVYAARFNTIIEKIRNRLVIMQEEGKDVAAAQAKLANAQVQLETAQKTTQAAINQFEAIDADNYEAQRELALQARDTAQQAREEFRSVLNLIKETVQLAKDAQ